MQNIHSLKFNAIGFGPGLGTDDRVESILIGLFTLHKDVFVIDADGINLIAANPRILELLTPDTILTPHVGEFDRLAGKSDNHYQRLMKAKELAKNYNCYFIIKGYHTAVVCPDGLIYFNSTGNPGMATAGSGDVLTGIILSLLAQNYSAKDAAVLGVYLHGLAGDKAIVNIHENSLIAGDIIEHLSHAFIEISA